MIGPRHAKAAALAFVALGGCLGEDGQPPPGAEGAGLDGPPGASTMVLSGCLGWHAVAMLPAALAPGAPPEGWPPLDPAEPIVKAALGGLECQRIAVGPFERGPATLLWDGHTNTAFPPACLDDAGGLDHRTFFVLNSLWASDAEVAAFLEGSFGLPARVGRFTTDAAPAGGSVSHEWAWSDAEAPGEPSRLRLVETQGVGGGLGLFQRLFWAAGEGIGFLDLDLEGTGSGFDSPAEATLRPPMLQHLPGGEEAVLRAQLRAPSGATGDIHLFSDRLCQEPLEEADAP